MPESTFHLQSIDFRGRCTNTFKRSQSFVRHHSCKATIQPTESEPLLLELTSTSTGPFVAGDTINLVATITNNTGGIISNLLESLAHPNTMWLLLPPGAIADGAVTTVAGTYTVQPADVGNSIVIPAQFTADEGFPGTGNTFTSNVDEVTV